MPDGRWLLLLLLQFMAGAAGADQTEAPSPEFLEFIGEWQTDDGEWIGPDELESSGYAGLGRVVQPEQEDEDSEYGTAE